MKYLVQRTGPQGHTEELVERPALEALLERDLRRGYAAAVGNPRKGYLFLGSGVREVLAHLDALAAQEEVRVLLVPQVAGG